MRYPWLAILLALLIGCSSKADDASDRITAGPAMETDNPAYNDGKKFIAALAEEFRSADRVVITEHSNGNDLVDQVKMVSKLPQDLVYKSVTLDSDQKRAFLKSLEGLNPATQNAFSFCNFAPHHSISFYRVGAVHSVLKVCFACADVEWSGIKAHPPGSIYSGLKKFLGAMGMQPTQDWTAVAQAHLERPQAKR